MLDNNGQEEESIKWSEV